MSIYIHLNLLWCSLHEVHLAGDKTGFFLSSVSPSTAFSAPGFLLCIFYQAQGEKKRKKPFLHTLKGLKESLIPLLPLALLAFHFLAALLGSRRLWLTFHEAFEAPEKWRDRFLISNSCLHSNAGLRTWIRTRDPCGLHLLLLPSVTNLLSC